MTETQWRILIAVLTVTFIAVFLNEAWEQDMKNRSDRDELTELREENEDLRDENWNLKDTNWILSTEINKIGAELRYLQLKETGEAE